MISNKRTFHEMIAEAATQYGEHPAFRFEDTKGNPQAVSFREFGEETEALAAWFTSNGFSRKQIAIFGENSYEWLLSLFAIGSSGNRAMPTDHALSPEDAMALFRRMDCTTVICSDSFEGRIAAFSEGGLHVIRMSGLSKMIAEGKELLARESSAKELLKKNRPEPDDPAAIYFTSGTSGEMKGVMLSHRNLIAVAVNTWGVTKSVWQPDIDHGNVLVLPLHHAFSMLGVMEHFLHGCYTYILRSFRNLKLVLKEVKPHMILTVPMMLETLLAQAKRHGEGPEAFGGRLSVVFCGGAPVSEELINSYHSIGIEIMPGYGITECSPVVSISNRTDRPYQCAGEILPGTEVRIADDGEILVRGETVFRGYFNAPKATAEAFRDGWFLTGDLGYIDDRHRVYVTGRKKNLIILSNGENVGAEELEERLQRIPYVQEVMVYGENDLIVAEVYLNPESGATEEDLQRDIKALNRTLPGFKNIGKVILRATEFPKTSSMKIKRTGAHYERKNQ